MRYVQALLILILVLTSKRYRREMREATERLSEVNEAVGASLRQLDAERNGGKPRLRVVST